MITFYRLSLYKVYNILIPELRGQEKIFMKMQDMKIKKKSLLEKYNKWENDNFENRGSIASVMFMVVTTFFVLAYFMFR